MTERDVRWVAAKDGHWYLLSTVFYCESECVEAFEDGGHYCDFTLRARRRHTGMSREIEKDIHRLPARGGEESADDGPGGMGGTANSDTSSWPFNNDPSFSRSGTFFDGNA
jgi:hypothetical protein